MVVSSPALPPPLRRQLHYVCGKGGVGKSAVAVALAQLFRRQGLNVLLVQVNAQDSHGPMLRIAPVGPQLREEAQRRVGLGGLHVVNITPAAAMKEYALMTLRFETLYRAVFENRLTRVFLRFIPALAELTMHGKIWFHSEEQDASGAHPRFDRIVVDCPATGHGLRFLRVAQIIRDASRVGPMAEKTTLMAQVIEDPHRTAVHVVALPEELPVNEAHDLVADIVRRRVAPLGLAFLNQCLPQLFDSAARTSVEQVRSRLNPHDETTALLDVAQRRIQREAYEREQRARLDALGLPVVELPLVFASPLGPDALETLADVVASSPWAAGVAP